MQTIASNGQYFEEAFDRVVLSVPAIADTEFEECDFRDCDFSNAIFKRCKFNDCTFTRCNLSLLDVSQSRFFAVTFSECKLVGMDWTRANWPSFKLPSELRFNSCILNDASFFGLTLNELELDACKLHDVDFREGDFSNSSITHCDLSNSLFTRTNLQAVDFTESCNFSINVFENNIARARFSRHEALGLLDSLDIELVD